MELISLIWLGRLFHRLQACGPKESLYVSVLANGIRILFTSDLVMVDDVTVVGEALSLSGIQVWW